jgi:hypothetical protein
MRRGVARLISPAELARRDREAVKLIKSATGRFSMTTSLASSCPLCKGKIAPNVKHECEFVGGQWRPVA